MTHPAENCTTLAELRAAVEAFDGCALKHDALNTVFADGNENAEMMIIGEAPGAREDEQGKPFVGRSGQLLDDLLLEIGFTRAENVYIANMMFWRPPENRNPSRTELASVRPFVDKHIALRQPKLVILLGNIAMKSMLGTKEGITKIHGTWQELHVPGLAAPIPAMPIYHPAFLLRNANMKQPCQQDLQKFRQRAVEMGILNPT